MKLHKNSFAALACKLQANWWGSGSGAGLGWAGLAGDIRWSCQINFTFYSGVKIDKGVVTPRYKLMCKCQAEQNNSPGIAYLS